MPLGNTNCTVLFSSGVNQVQHCSTQYLCLSSPRWYSSCSAVLVLVFILASVFWTWLLKQSYWSKLISKCCGCQLCFSLTTYKKICESNIICIHELVGESAVCILNKSGARIGPWGTPSLRCNNMLFNQDNIVNILVLFWISILKQRCYIDHVGKY